MKRCLAILTLMTLISPARAADFAGFLHLPWGADPKAVKEQVTSHLRGRLDRQRSTDSKLEFEGGKLAGFKVARAETNFANDRLYRVEIEFEPASRDHMKEYAALKQMLTQKYGAPRSERAGPMLCIWSVTAPGNLASTVELAHTARSRGVFLYYALANGKDRVTALPAPPPTLPKPAATNPVDDL